MRVLVTGGAGFVGSNLVQALLDRGDQVVILDNLDPFYPSALKQRNIASFRGDYRFFTADVLDPAALQAAMEGVDAVAHLAARVGVRPSLQDPAPYIRTNVEGTLRVLTTLTRLGVPHLVLASSSSVYGARTSGPFREDDPPAIPASPYAASKLAAETLCDTWQRLHGFSLTTLRLFTAYGPRQRPDMAIHRFARSILAGRPITLFGDGSTSRDYTYVGDMVRGLVAAIDRPLGRAVLNLGNNRPVRLDELVLALGRALGRTPHMVLAPAQPGELPMTWADTERARHALDWAPQTHLSQGLEAFVDWLLSEGTLETTVDPRECST